MKKNFVITMWTKKITDSGKNEYTKVNYKGYPYKFRLLDDDEIVYAYGYSKTNNDENAFLPLDCYEGAYGVTMIEYWNSETKEWEML